jgi:signal transduction histidine kinase
MSIVDHQIGVLTRERDEARYQLSRMKVDTKRLQTEIKMLIAFYKPLSANGDHPTHGDLAALLNELEALTEREEKSHG